MRKVDTPRNRGRIGRSSRAIYGGSPRRPDLEPLARRRPGAPLTLTELTLAASRPPCHHHILVNVQTVESQLMADVNASESAEVTTVNVRNGAPEVTFIADTSTINVNVPDASARRRGPSWAALIMTGFYTLLAGFVLGLLLAPRPAPGTAVPAPHPSAPTVRAVIQPAVSGTALAIRQNQDLANRVVWKIETGRETVAMLKYDPYPTGKVVVVVSDGWRYTVDTRNGLMVWMRPNEMAGKDWRVSFNDEPGPSGFLWHASQGKAMQICEGPWRSEFPESAERDALERCWTGQYARALTAIDKVLL